ncbi:MAG TPA: NlpC/P60 family protein [Hyphomicrobiales bacterium]|nr:C40 family peptidase [Rhodobiaceae bacterium]HXK53519.1 NlpC/P60 family protein [Hyphomicrobiales bacterium]
MSEAPDPRRHPWRSDLAAASLRGKVPSARYVEGREMRVVCGQSPLRAAPDPGGSFTSEALFGETFTVFEEREGWAWGQLASDGYVGYLAASALGAPGLAPTHRVGALRSYLYPGPDIKVPPLDLLSMNSLVAVEAVEGGFARLAGSGYMTARHLCALPQAENDFVAIAERFVGTPYLWGGRSSLGLDCSALVQMALAACAIACPRDSDMQQNELGEPVDPGRLDEVARGDLIFWRGHVAIAAGAGMLVHANAHHMMVVREPQDAAVARIAAAGLEVRAIRRLFRS